MENVKAGPWIRVLLIICGLALIPVLFVPLWKIDLVAPQYPEGLMLLIYPDKLAGNVDIINGLNHYIGMKTLHTADFPEFTFLPFIIGFFTAAFILVGMIGRRKLVYVLCGLFVGFGILAMCDFWRWEYNYGHNLSPEAAIIVPGMAYQPPLIGFKQLLNFGAYSMPNTGGWIFAGVGAVLLFCTVMTRRARKKKVFKPGSVVMTIVVFSMVSLGSCSSGPDPIKTGTDNCYSCKMTMSDPRFGAEIVTTKSKTYKFDDIHCVLSYLQTKDLSPGDIKDIYLVNFCGNHGFINVNNAFLLKADELRSPMGGNIAAFDNRDSLMKVQQQYPGTPLTWESVRK